MNEEELAEIHALCESVDSEAFMNFANEKSQKIGQINRDLETHERLRKRDSKKIM